MQTRQTQKHEIIMVMVCCDKTLLFCYTTSLTTHPGNGRRLCPGIHLADRNLFHAIAKILWAFDLSMAVDEKTGKPVVPDTSIVTGYREGLTACADAFPIKMTVRSDRRRKAIEEAFKEAQDGIFMEYEGMNLWSKS